MKVKIITIIVLFLSLGLGQDALAKRVKGSGNVITETRDLSSFHTIDVGGAFHIELIQSSDEKIIIETDDNIMPYIVTKVSGGELDIYNDVSINNPTKLNLTIYYKNLSELEISGAAELFSSGILDATHLKLDFSGAAEVTLKLDAKNLDCEFSGASSVNLDGVALNAEIDASGASVLKAFGLEIDNLNLEASGASTVKVLVNDKLQVDASGAASIRYKGNPDLRVEDVSGAASFRKG